MSSARGTVLLSLAIVALASCAHAPSPAPAYREQCEDEDHARSCVALGRLYEDGSGGVDRDPEHARDLFQRACDAGYAKGCVDLGVLYEGGDGVAQDWNRAAMTFQRACDRGAPAGCNDLGNLYAEGHGVDPDPARARSLFQKACDGGVDAGCYNAVNLGAAAPGATAGTPDAGIAGASTTDAGAPSSTVMSFASIYVDGKPVSVSSTQGAALMGTVNRMEQLATQMSALAQQMCRQKGAGCYHIDKTVTSPGSVTMFVNGQRVDGDGAQVKLGHMRARLQKECDEGNAVECFALSMMYAAGSGAPLDAQRASQLRQQACKGGLSIACALAK